MKILFAIKNMRDAKGGAERVLSFVVNGLAEKGHDVSLLTFDRPDGGEPFYPIDERIEQICLGIGDAEQKSGLWETLKRMRAIRKAVKEHRPDIIVPFMHSMFIPLAFAVPGMGIPVVASEHIVPVHYQNRRHEYLLLLLSSFFVKEITVLSDAVKSLYPGFVRRKMSVMPNPVYIEPASAGNDDFDPARKVILNVGRLSDQKDQETLIRAFAQLADGYPDWDVRIAGEGEKAEVLKSLISELNLSPRVKLIGTTRRIAAEYQSAEIFAMPSKYESFGLATAEAMSFGTPAVGFWECPGTNEIIEHEKNGLLVNRDERYINNFAEALERLMTDQALRMDLGQKARQSIKEYSPEKIVNRWEKLIQKAA